MISRRRHCCDVYIYFFIALTSTVDISTQQLTPRQSRFTNSTTGKRKTMYFRVNCPFKNVTKRSSVKHVLNVVLQSVLFFSNMVSCPSIPFTESCCIVGKKKIFCCNTSRTFFIVVVVYQNLFELLLLALIWFLPPSLPGVLGKHTSSTLTLDETVQHQSTDSWSKVKTGHLPAFVPSMSTDESPHRKSDSLFQFINDAHPPVYIVHIYWLLLIRLAQIPKW